MTDWNDAFANAKYIEDAERYPNIWASEAQQFSEENAHSSALDQPYGSHPREIYDHFQVDRPDGMLVFVHGGYWRAFDKNSWSHLAKGGMAHGLDVILPSYPLCPEVSIAEITKSIQKLILSLPSNLPLYLVGHSAGGHLVARMSCKGMLPDAVQRRIRNIMPISGLFDLRPLIQTTMNDDFALSQEGARMESPALCEAEMIPVTAWVGGDERPEFIRQTQLIESIWRGLDIPIKSVIENEKHHFDVINGLKDPNSDMIKTLLEIK